LLELIVPKPEWQQAEPVPQLLAAPVLSGCLLLAALIASFGYLSFTAVGWFALVAGVIIISFGAAIRSGLNKRFANPSLATPQLLVCGLPIAYLAYVGDEARPAFIAMYLVALMSGTLWVNTSRLMLISAFYLLCYAGVVVLAVRNHPDLDVPRELFRIIAVALLFGACTLVGGYVNRLRQDLEAVNARMRSSLDQANALARIDTLTGCYNRRRGLELLDIECSRAARGGSLSVALADIDQFKSINDTAGHAAGDEVLRQFCLSVQGALRATDFLVRYGGEEFLIVFSQTSLDGALTVAERILHATRQTLRPDGKPLTVSIGVAEHTRGATAAETIARGDLALYRAKHAGRDRIVTAEPTQA